MTIKAFDSLPITSVGIDLIAEGGELYPLTDDGGGYWSGVVNIPETVSPGDIYLPVKVMDSGGGWSILTHLNLPSTVAGVGGDAWDAPTASIPALLIENSGPVISDFQILTLALRDAILKCEAEASLVVVISYKTYFTSTTAPAASKASFAA